MQLRLAHAARAEVTEVLALPLETPLAEWPAEVCVEVHDVGLARHVVRFVEVGGALVACKEMHEELVRREARSLAYLAEQDVPSVELMATATERGGDGEGLLLTRYLEFSLPYRALFRRHVRRETAERLLDALVELLVRLHLVGFFWGDCSLSNALFRRDAGELAAHLVDAETAEVVPALTPGQRRLDLALATERVAGGMADLVAERTGSGATVDLDPLWAAEELERRYLALWSELTREELIDAGDRYRVEDRIRRLNDLGFDVAELVLRTTDGGAKLALATRVVEPGYHRRELASLTGLDVGENQARRLLNDLNGYRAWLSERSGSDVPKGVAASRWLAEVYEPAIASVPLALRHKLEPAELFHQVLDHRWFLSEAQGRDVGTREAVRSFCRTVLPYIPDERAPVEELDPGFGAAGAEASSDSAVSASGVSPGEPGAG